MRKGFQGCVYIVANLERTCFYIAVTDNLERKIWEHKADVTEMRGKRECIYLMYYENYNHIGAAKARQRELKQWRRDWLKGLIQKNNPDMVDLAANWFDKLKK